MTWLIMATCLFTCFIPGQAEEKKSMGLMELIQKLDEESSITLKNSGITVSDFSFENNEKHVEAITFKPRGNGPHPGLLLIPGYSRSARDYVPLGVTLAKEGFASIAVTQPGFGRSKGAPDWVGPSTLAALTSGYERFKALTWVDASRMGACGYSRGAVAAALLSVRLDDLKAAVFAAGIYDLKLEYETNVNPGIRENMKIETGLEEEAFRARSPLFMMERLKCPVLILHGEKDVNASVTQAKRLGLCLEELKKPFEIRLYPDKDHNLGRKAFNEAVIEFFKRRLVDAEEMDSPVNNPGE